MMMRRTQPKIVRHQQNIQQNKSASEQLDQTLSQDGSLKMSRKANLSSGERVR
jgi:hypothetical protein